MEKRRLHFFSLTRSKSITLIYFLFLLPLSISAQTKVIKGKVADKSSGEILIGVTIQEKGTQQATVTNVDGNFSINVNEGATLIFRYMGYKGLELPATNNMDVKMETSVSSLDEVVVVGYGVQKKSVVTAAISGVKAEDLGKMSPSRIDNVLRGQVSGVSITQQSGQPGEGSRVRIRGVGTINDSNPLYIVDGMPVEEGIDYLNPADVESIEILKDAASAAIYGTRGANGVILVTTKKGKKGKATINYNMSYGWQNAWKKRDVLNAEEYKMIMSEIGNVIDPSLENNNTDWQKEVFNKNAPVTSHQLNVSGGTDMSSYFLSFGYFNQEGIVGGNFKRSNYDRYTLRLNNDYVLLDEKDRNFLNKLKVGVSASYSRTKSTGVTTNDQYGGILAHAIMAPPIFPVIADAASQTAYAKDDAQKYGIKNPDGDYYYIFGSQTNEIVNPIASLSLPGIKKSEDKFIASFWAELSLYKDLVLKSSYGSDLYFWENNYATDRYYLSPTNFKDRSEVLSAMNRRAAWQIENTLRYHFSVNQKHNITFLLGQSAKASRNRVLEGTAYALLDPSLGSIDATTVASDSRATGRIEAFHKLASYFGRINYDYNELYMAEFTIRRDGSSNFGSNNRWANFPSVSVGWNVTNEKFMQNRPQWLSSLKVRGSWGINGNENIQAFNYAYFVKPGQNYPLGLEGKTEMTPGIAPESYSNPSTKWEESEQLDFGFDSSLLAGALTFSFDWFKKKTNGMLMQMALPEYLGANTPYANVGDMQNSGVEFDLGYRFRVSDFNFKVGANASYVKNKLIKLGNEEGWANYDGASTIGTISRAQNGAPFPFFYGMTTNGVFQNQQQIDAYVNNEGTKLQPNASPGDVIFVDVNKDGIIDDNDKTRIGKGMPDWTYGFNLQMDWKGFDLSANFQGTIGNDIFDATRRTDISIANLPSYTLGRWHGEGTSNKYPRLINGANNNWISSDLYVKNGSFLRLRTLQIGYSLPQNLIKKAFIRNLRFFASAENLLTITSYEGYDPEISSGGTSLGIDRGIYPQPRTFSIGANITF
ncbi:MAG: TonB-dependent receptor [Dysgonamonadaceae bacterium]